MLTFPLYHSLDVYFYHRRPQIRPFILKPENSSHNSDDPPLQSCLPTAMFPLNSDFFLNVPLLAMSAIMAG
jgi:hypothetical protein